MIAYIKDGATVSVMHSSGPNKSDNASNEYVSVQQHTNARNTNKTCKFNLHQHESFDDSNYIYDDADTNSKNNRLDAQINHSYSKRKSNNIYSVASVNNPKANSSKYPKSNQMNKRKTGHEDHEDDVELNNFSPTKHTKTSMSLKAELFNQNTNINPGYANFFEQNGIYNNKFTIFQQSQPSAVTQNSFSSNSSSSSSVSSSSSNSSTNSSTNFLHQNFLQQQQQQQFHGANETIQEASARMLFMSIKWCKSLPSFASLQLRDQIILLEESWSEIFLLCALQWSLNMEVNPLLTAVDYSQDKSNLRIISELIQKFKLLNADGAEFAFLKAIVLFKSGKFFILIYNIN